MDYHILVNKENGLNKTYVPSRLVDTKSKYKDNILIDEIVLINFNNMREDALKNGLEIDIMSGYRDYFYQEKLYNRLLKEKGYAYTFRSVAKPEYLGKSIDIVEKDYYVTMILKILSEHYDNVVFKGGTSLSKALHVLTRFSEDIDITFLNTLEHQEGKSSKML